MPGLSLPAEPELPSRRRRLILAAAAVMLLSAVGLLLWRASTAGQFQDPALSGETEAGAATPGPTPSP